MIELKTKLLSLDVFTDSEWLDKYCSLIYINRFREPQKNITNCHHIIPRSLFILLGKDSDDSCENKVNLIYSDHLLAHYYLMKAAHCYAVRCQNACGMIFSYIDPRGATLSEEWLISHARELDEAYVISKQHASAAVRSRWNSLTDDEKEQYADNMRKCIKQLKTIHKGAVELRVPADVVESYLQQGYVLGRSDRSKASVSAAKTGSIPWNKGKKNLVTVSEETRKILSELAMGHSVSQETRASIGAKNRGKIYVSKEEVVKKIAPEELSTYLQNGWVRGSVKNKGMSGRVTVNNGIKSVSIREEELQEYLVEGWVRGRHDVAPTRGRVSPTAGKMWITDGVRNRVVLESDFLSNYDLTKWRRGRVRAA